MVAVLVACTEGRDPRDPPASEDRFAELTFPLECGAVEVAVTATGAGWDHTEALPADCAGIGLLEETGARLEEACAAAGEAPDACAGAGRALVVEVQRLAARPHVDAMEVVPLDPAALREEGSDAELVITFADGSSERWTNGTRSWGTRFVHVTPDGTVDAQGSRVFTRSAGCDVVRDHRIGGTIEAAGVFSVDYLERDDLACAGATMAVDYTQATATP